MRPVRRREAGGGGARKAAGGGSRAGLRLGIVGWPLGYSLSPRLHEAALGALGLRGEYRLAAIAPEQAEAGLRGVMAGLREGEWQGLNVTIPYKERVLGLVDAHSQYVGQVGAANTLVAREGRVWAENTDLPGFAADLRRAWGQLKGPRGERQALVLGAGGAARAVVAALLLEGWQVSVAARRAAQAGALCAALQALGKGAQALALQPGAEFQRSAEGASLLVNTTPVGMHPHLQESPWPEGVRFPETGLAYDLVYNPAETRFLQQARAAGMAPRGGIGMLIEQAALALELWLAASRPGQGNPGAGDLIRQAMRQAAPEYPAGSTATARQSFSLEEGL